MEDQRKPWVVARVKPGAEEGDDKCFNVIQRDFKVQVEADDWIKSNIKNDEVLVSIRLGKGHMAVTRTAECDV